MIQASSNTTRLATALAMALTLGLGASSTWAQSAVSEQADGNWLVRVRAVHLDSANKGSTTPDLGLSMNNKWLPEVDFSYFFTPNWAAELILTVPQKQKLYANGTQIGSFKHLPPVLTLQYHVTGLPYGIKPYVGAGVNYTRFSDRELPAGVSMDNDSLGGALQVGVDVPIGKNLYFNVDVKKVYIKTDVKLAGEKIGSFKADPVLVGVGLGWRF